MKNQRGQSIVEILVAVGVFSLIVSAVALLIIDSYTSNRLGRELSQATFLAEEGLEATRSMRDNDWNDLSLGVHGIAIAANLWTFSGVSDSHDQFVRTVEVEELTAETKRITSQVTWDFTKNNSYNVALITHLTDWQKISPYCGGLPDACDLFTLATCLDQEGCYLGSGTCSGICTSCPGLNQAQCTQQLGCRWQGNQCRNNPSCTTCDTLLDLTSCQSQLGCSWNPGTCAGTPLSCDNYPDQTSCQLQSGCGWIIP